MSEQDAIAYRDARVAQSSQDYGNPVSYVEYSTALTSVASGRYGAAFMRDRVALEQPARFPSANAAYRTLTSALDGAYPLLPASTLFVANPGGREKARFFADVRVRGNTGLTDDPVISFRPYVRQGGSTGVAAAAEAVNFTRPRLKDLASIYFLLSTNSSVAYTQQSSLVIDNSAATGADLVGLAGNSSCFFIIGGPVPFNGMAVDMDASAVNAAATSITMKYWNGTSWAALANVTDGTSSGGKTLDHDGLITWDLPADWTTVALTSLSLGAYWAQGSVSTGLTTVGGQTAIEIEELDLLLPLQAAIDVQADGDDVALLLEAQLASTSGTMVLSTNSTVRVSWR